MLLAYAWFGNVTMRRLDGTRCRRRYVARAVFVRARRLLARAVFVRALRLLSYVSIIFGASLQRAHA